MGQVGFQQRVMPISAFKRWDSVLVGLAHSAKKIFTTQPSGYTATPTALEHLRWAFEDSNAFCSLIWCT
jgi:hypothetical protein